MTLFIAALVVLTIVLLIVFAVFPQQIVSPAGKVMAFVAIFLLPTLTASFGVSEHLERSKKTSFCLSCHVMHRYGRSLHVDDPTYLPAAHFQNNRIPREYACYTCHTDYAFFGGVRSKIRGLRHVYKQYISHPSDPIKLYQPFNNRECLHCHEGARSFEAGVMHNADPETMPAIKSNKLSCVSSGCHDVVHNVKQLDKVMYWQEGK